MLLVQSCQTFVTCEKDQTGMTGEETPPLCFPHQRRQQYIDADNNDDNHLFHSYAHKCPKFGNHQNSDVPRKCFPITKYQFHFFNYVFSITYYLFPNTNYLFAKIKTIDTTIPYLGTKIPRYEDTVSWCTKTEKNTKSTKSKNQMQEPSQKPFVKTFSTPSNSYQPNPIQVTSSQPIATMIQYYPGTMPQFYLSTMPQRYFATMIQYYLGTMPQFYLSTMPICYFATMLQYYYIIMQQYFNATMLECSHATSLRCYNNMQHTCYAINIWQIIHESNQTLLQQDKAFVAKEKLSTDVQSYFLPFISGSPILSVELYSNSLLATLDTGCTKN